MRISTASLAILHFMTSSLVPRFATCLLLSLFLGTIEVSAQKVFGLPASAMHDNTACQVAGCDGLVGIAEDHFAFTPPPTTYRSSVATIQVTYTGFPAAAEAAVDAMPDPYRSLLQWLLEHTLV